MKPRTIAIAAAGGLVVTALAIGAVLGISHLLTRSPQTAPLANRDGGLKEMPPFVGGGAPPRIAVDFAPPAFDDAVVVEPFGAGAPVKPIERIADLRGAAPAGREAKLSVPLTHENLTVFLVRGPGKAAANVITLQEALDANLATVHEGLSISNRSDKALFVQAGDIVKGGTQDRVLPYDYLSPAGASRFPVAALCVESGRSFARAGEASSYFEMSCERLPTTNLRLAAYRRAQGEVWAGVARTQEELGRVLGASVRASLSSTSLQLTLEHPVVKDATSECVNKLLPSILKEEDAVGMVVVVNGKIQSADIYGSADLFRKMSPKLLRAAAVERLTLRDRSKATVPSPEAVQAFLDVPESARASEMTGSGRLRMITQETSGAALFDACDRDAGNAVIHRTVLAR
ncbi:MAG: DUF6569 family protein [Gemmataceae bacterium]